jgi:hypothetical protein
MVASQGKNRRLSLAVIIVSYNVRDLLRNCLSTVFAAAEQNKTWLDVRVIVVDNASRDGSSEMVAAEFPNVDLIASPENLGFTGGNNAALELLGFQKTGAENPLAGSSHPRLPSPDFVLLLNPDTEIVEDALGRMAAFLRDHPRAGACGAYLCYGDGTFQHGAFYFPGLMQVFLDLYPLANVPGLRRFVPRLLNSRINGRYPTQLWQSAEPFPVDFVLGAAMMVQGKAIREVGVLDDGYFMYCEEMDWCLRLAQAGWPVYAIPSARVIHHEGQSSKQDPWASFERLWRSRLRFYTKHAARYPRLFRIGLRLLVRGGLTVRSWYARRRFERGKIDLAAFTQEIEAYRRLAQTF